MAILAAFIASAMEEARKRRLSVSKRITFDCRKWVFEGLDDDVEAAMRTYEGRDSGSDENELDAKHIDSFSITLKPPKGFDQMQFFKFSNKLVNFADVKKCDVEQ